MNLIQLQKAMGHRSVDTTRLYLSDVEAYLNRRHRRFDLDEALAQVIKADGEAAT